MNSAKELTDPDAQEYWRVGDKILAVNGVKVLNWEQFSKAVALDKKHQTRMADLLRNSASGFLRMNLYWGLGVVEPTPATHFILTSLKAGRTVY